MSDDMNSMLRELEETSNRLVSSVSEVSTRLNTAERMQRELAEQQRLMRRQQKHTRTQRGVNLALSASLVLDLVLSVLIGFGFLRVDSNADKIQQIQQRTDNEVLCPEKRFWLSLLDRTPERPDDTPEQIRTRTDFRRLLNESVDTLNCPPIGDE